MSSRFCEYNLTDLSMQEFGEDCGPRHHQMSNQGFLKLKYETKCFSTGETNSSPISASVVTVAMREVEYNLW